MFGHWGTKAGLHQIVWIFLSIFEQCSIFWRHFILLVAQERDSHMDGDHPRHNSQIERSHCSAGESKNRGGVRWDGLPPNQMVAPTDPAGWSHPGRRTVGWKCPDVSRVLWNNNSPHWLVYCHRILLQMGYMFISTYTRTNYNIIYFLPAYWWITYQNHSSHSSNSWPTLGPRLQRWDKIRPNSHHCGHPSARSGRTKRGSATWPQMAS